MYALPSAKLSQPSPSPLAHLPEPITFACTVGAIAEKYMMAVVIACLRECCFLLQWKSFRSPSALDCESCSRLDVLAVDVNFGVKDTAKFKDKARVVIMHVNRLNMVILMVFDTLAELLLT